MTAYMGRITRRQFVKGMGAMGGAGAAYHALTAMGLLGIPPASAETQPLMPGVLDGVDIVVVGAGLAGLCAAYRAANAGANVTVLEAEQRYGGRSLTVRPEGEVPTQGWLAVRFRLSGVGLGHPFSLSVGRERALFQRRTGPHPAAPPARPRLLPPV